MAKSIALLFLVAAMVNMTTGIMVRALINVDDTFSLSVGSLVYEEDTQGLYPRNLSI